MVALVVLIVVIALLWWLAARRRPEEIATPTIEPATPAKPLEPARPDIVAAEPAFKKVATPPPAPAPAPVAETSPPAATPLPVAEPAAPPPAPAPATGKADNLRSEEHTSELQSLMRISYAVFCLKKKNKTHNK